MTNDINQKVYNLVLLNRIVDRFKLVWSCITYLKASSELIGGADAISLSRNGRVRSKKIEYQENRLNV